MFLFKTSGETFDSVIVHKKHASTGIPKGWYPSELILVSKNKLDCKPYEKQISHIMEFENVRLLLPGEADKYWPGNEGRWNYLIECKSKKRLKRPFNLEEVIGQDQFRQEYHPVVSFKRLSPPDEKLVQDYINITGTF